MVPGSFHHYDGIKYHCLRGVGHKITILGISGDSIDSIYFYCANRFCPGCYKYQNWYFDVEILLTLGLNVITEFVAGYWFPGKPLANMMIKTYGSMTMWQVRSLHHRS